MELRRINCPQCGIEFYLCSCCDRGHRYCSKKCQKQGRQASVRRARKKYAQSPRGLIKNRVRQRRHRRRQTRQRNQRQISAKNQIVSKTVTDHSYSQSVIGLKLWHGGSMPTPEKAIKPGSAGFCSFCGCHGVLVERISFRGRFRTRSNRR
jgi:hypothetical protein